MGNSQNLSCSKITVEGEGEYTEEQVNILKAQKENVKNVILGQQSNRPETSSSTSANSSTFSSHAASTTNSSLASSSLSHKLKAAYDWSENTTWRSLCQLESPNERVSTQVAINDNSPCDFMVCARCRPNYKERAFGSLTSMVIEPLQLPPEWEVNNRRVSNAHIVSGFGLPKLRNLGVLEFVNQSRESFGQWEEEPEVYHEHKTGKNEHKCNTRKHSVRRRSGFRETVRKTLKLAREEQEPRRSLDKETNAKAVQPGFLRNVSRSMLLLRRMSLPSPPSSPAQSTVVESTPLQDSLMLMLAANTPLPSDEHPSKHATNPSQHSLHMPLGSSPLGASMADLIAWA